MSTFALFLACFCAFFVSSSVVQGFSHFCPRPAACDTCLSVELAGTVATFSDPDSILDFTIAAASAFDGYYDYNTTELPNAGGNSTTSTYVFSGANEGFHIAVHVSPVFLFETTPALVPKFSVTMTNDDDGSDGISFSSTDNVPINGTSSYGFRWGLTTTNLGTLSNTSLLTIPVSLTTFTQVNNAIAVVFNKEGFSPASILLHVTTATSTSSSICPAATVADQTTGTTGKKATTTAAAAVGTTGSTTSVASTGKAKSKGTTGIAAVVDAGDDTASESSTDTGTIIAAVLIPVAVVAFVLVLIILEVLRRRRVHKEDDSGRVEMATKKASTDNKKKSEAATDVKKAPKKDEKRLSAAEAAKTNEASSSELEESSSDGGKKKQDEEDGSTSGSTESGSKSSDSGKKKAAKGTKKD